MLFQVIAPRESEVSRDITAGAAATCHTPESLFVASELRSTREAGKRKLSLAVLRKLQHPKKGGGISPRAAYCESECTSWSRNSLRIREGRRRASMITSSV